MFEIDFTRNPFSRKFFGGNVFIPLEERQACVLVIFPLLSQHNIRLSQVPFTHLGMCSEINLTFALFCAKSRAHKQAEYCLHEDLQSLPLSEEVKEKCHGKQLQRKKGMCIVTDCRCLVYRVLL